MTPNIQKNGFTFVELLVAVFILAGAISGALLLFTSSMLSSQQAWDTTVAVSHAEFALEEAQSRNSLDDILSINWKDWAQEQRLYTLPDEAIKVAYTDPDTNPLEIAVSVQWTRKSRENEIALRTKITR